MNYTNILNLPIIAEVFLAHDTYDHPEQAENTISATGLLKSVREIILTSRMEPSEMSMDVSRLLASRMGSAVHDGFERAWLSPRLPETLKSLGYPAAVIKKIHINPESPTGELDVYLEKRTNKLFQGYTISGQFDFVFDGEIWDIKNTTMFSWFKDPKEYILQLSIYAWLNPEIITVETGKILFNLKDWNKHYIHSKDGYPQSPIADKRLPLLPVIEVEQFISNKLSLLDEHRNTPEPELPLCTKEELWQGDSTYNYYGKIDAKRASKSFDNKAEAVNWQLSKGKGFVKEVLSAPTRCTWCQASSVCSQAQGFVNQGLIQLGG